MGWNDRLVTLKNNPCNGCTYETGRHAGCHSVCGKYIKAKAEHEKVLEKRRAEYNEKAECIRYVANVIAKSKKRKSH